MSEAFPTKYLSHSDLQGQDHTLTIKSVEMDKVGEDTKPIMYFHGAQKGLALNVTNTRTITSIFQSDESDDWIGKQITLGVSWVDYKGEQVQAIRVRPQVRQPQNVPGNSPPAANPPGAVFHPNVTQQEAAQEAQQEMNSDNFDSQIPF